MTDNVVSTKQAILKYLSYIKDILRTSFIGLKGLIHKAPKDYYVMHKMRMFMFSVLIGGGYALLRLYLPFALQNVFLWGIVYFFLAIVTYITTIIIINAPLKFTKFTILAFPAIFVFLASFSIHFVFAFQIVRFSYQLMFFILIIWYILFLFISLLTATVLNTNMHYFVPLSKLAEGSFKFLFATMHFLALFIILAFINGQYTIYIFNYVFIFAAILGIFWLWFIYYGYYVKTYDKNGLFFAGFIVFMYILFNLVFVLFISSRFLLVIMNLLFLIILMENLENSAKKGELSRQLRLDV